MDYAVKAALADPSAGEFVLDRQRTMYGGKLIAVGDAVFVFDSETSGGAGLCARGVAKAVAAVPLVPGVARQVPLVNLTIRREAVVRRRLLRAEVRGFADWGDGRPQTELNFKFYRQATDKLVGISPELAGFLAEYF
ncbi:MAG: hypothetical protein ABI832_20995 [bacterium]